MIDFRFGDGVSFEDLASRLVDRVRFERKRLQLSQSEFAMRCNIPLRTYKRFELGQCDSLLVFIRIVVEFERTTAFELLFPPRPVDSRDPLAKLGQLIRYRSEPPPESKESA